MGLFTTTPRCNKVVRTEAVSIRVVPVFKHADGSETAPRWDACDVWSIPQASAWWVHSVAITLLQDHSEAVTVKLFDPDTRKLLAVACR